MSEAAHDQPLFSYGTLQFDTVQTATFGRLVATEDDALSGYRIVTITIRDPTVLDASGIEEHLALVPDADAPPIAGKVLLLSAAELAAADVYESENYRRDRVVLASGRAAWVYVKA